MAPPKRPGEGVALSDSPPSDEKLFAPEGPADGCASGACLPDVPPPGFESVSSPTLSATQGAPAPVSSASGPSDPAVAAPPAKVPSVPVADTGWIKPTFELTPSPPDEPEEEEPPPAPGSGTLQEDKWRRIIEVAKKVSIRHGVALSHARLLSIAGGEVQVGFSQKAKATLGFYVASLNDLDGKKKMEEVLSKEFGRPTKLTVKDVAETEAAGPSLAEKDATEKAAHEKSTEAKVRNHPAVLMAMKKLAAELEHIQVLQKERPSGPTEELPTERDS